MSDMNRRDGSSGEGGRSETTAEERFNAGAGPALKEADGISCISSDRNVGTVIR